MQLGNGDTSGSIVGNVAIANNGVLIFNRSDDIIFAGVISGAGSTTQAGIGMTTLTGISGYTGNTTVSAGELRLENGGQITASSALTIAGSNNQNAVLTVDGVGSRLVAGSGNVGQFGTGVLNIQDGAQAEFGTLSMTANPPGNGTVNVRGVGSNLTVTSTGISRIAITGTAVLNILDGATAAYGGTANLGFGASGTGTAIVSGAGSKWTVANALNIDSGSVSVLDSAVVTSGGAFTLANWATATGILTIAGGGRVEVGSGTLALRTGTAILTIGGVKGAAAMAAGTLDAASVTFGGVNSRINFNHIDTDYIFASAISGAGKVNQTSTGTTILTAENRYTGGTTITAGTLQLGNGGTTGSITGDILDNGALIFNRSDVVTFGGLISGTGSVKQAGIGTTLLTNANTYAGGTTIAAVPCNWAMAVPRDQPRAISSITAHWPSIGWTMSRSTA